MILIHGEPLGRTVLFLSVEQGGRRSRKPRQGVKGPAEGRVAYGMGGKGRKGRKFSAHTLRHGTPETPGCRGVWAGGWVAEWNT